MGVLSKSIFLSKGRLSNGFFTFNWLKNWCEKTPNATECVDVYKTPLKSDILKERYCYWMVIFIKAMFLFHCYHYIIISSHKELIIFFYYMLPRHSLLDK